MYRIVIILFCLFWVGPILAQKDGHSERVKAGYRIDSLQKRIVELKLKLKETKPIPLQYYRTLDDFTKTEFLYQYEKYCINEDLESAKDLVHTNLNEAQYEEVDHMVDFYKEYDKDIDARIKTQRIKYQELFGNKKAFKKKIEPLIKENTEESLEQARWELSLAEKYAREQNLPTTIEMIETYQAEVEAKTFNLSSEIDLEKMSNNGKYFDQIIDEMIDTDDLMKYTEAKQLVSNCIFYAEHIPCKISIEYMERKKKYIDSQLMRRESELSATALIAGGMVSKKEQSMDSINDFGIYKFHDKIVVIGKFNPSKEGFTVASSADVRVMKGMAVMNSDKLLITYINRNLKQIPDNSRAIHAYFIPYLIKGKNQWFYPIGNSDELQYRVAYSFIHSEKTTRTLLDEHFTPIVFVRNEDK